MPDERTDRHGLPLLQAGQAQKEMTHNEALVMLDMLAMAAVEDVAEAVPVTPLSGQCWIVGVGADGEWAGRAGAIAGWTTAGWRFLGPREGMRCWVAAAEMVAVRRNGAWRIGEVSGSALRIDGTAVVGPRAAAIADPTGGAAIDVEGRAAIASILRTMRDHGLIATA